MHLGAAAAFCCSWTATCCRSSATVACSCTICWQRSFTSRVRPASCCALSLASLLRTLSSRCSLLTSPRAVASALLLAASSA